MMDLEEFSENPAATSALVARDSYILARFLTKTPKFAVPDTTYSLLSSTNVDDLNTLLNKLIKESADLQKDDAEPIEFDFLINGEILIKPLGEFIQRHAISTEDVILIEYIERLPAPVPDKSLRHSDWVSAVHSLETLILTGSYDHKARIFSNSGSLVLNIETHSSPIKSVAFVEASKNGGSFLTSSHDQTIAFWNWDASPNGMHNVTPKAIYRGHAASVDCISVNPDRKKFCSASWDKTLKIWSLEDSGQDELFASGEPPEKRQKVDGRKLTRVPLSTLSGHRESVGSCIWTSTNEIMTASMDRTIRIWDVELGGISRELDSSKALITIAYSPLSRLLISGGTDRHVRLYDPRSNEGAIVKTMFTSHQGWVPSVSWSPMREHYFISGSYDKLMKMWDTRNPKCPLYDMAGHHDKILCTSWTDCNLLLSGGTDNELKIFRASV